MACITSAVDNIRVISLSLNVNKIRPPCLVMFTTRVIRGSPKLTRDLYVLISRSPFQKLSSMSSQKPKVYVTRRVPQDGLEILRPHCEITQWDSEKPVPRDELIRQVAGKDALFCLLTDKIDVDVLNTAGMTLVKN